MLIYWPWLLVILTYNGGSSTNWGRQQPPLLFSILLYYICVPVINKVLIQYSLHLKVYLHLYHGFNYNFLPLLISAIKIIVKFRKINFFLLLFWTLTLSSLLFEIEIELNDTSDSNTILDLTYMPISCLHLSFYFRIGR